MKKVLHRLGASLNLHARSASDLCKQMSRYQSCLLILDRCEAAVSQSRLQFCWLLSQLLTQARVKVLLSSQQPLKGFPEPDAEGEASLSFGVVSLEPMIPKDAALLLLENCEREPAELLEELGNNDGNTSVLEALTAHPLLRELGGIPVVVRWAAAKLGETSVRRLHAEVRALLASSGRNKLVQIAHQAAAAASVGEVTPPVAAATASGGPTPPRERPSRSPRLARHHSSRMSAANAEAEAAAAARLAAASASASGQRDLSEWRGGDAHLAPPQPSAQLATAMAKLKACMAEVASAAAAEGVNPTIALDAAASDAARGGRAGAGGGRRSARAARAPRGVGPPRRPPEGELGRSALGAWGGPRPRALAARGCVLLVSYVHLLMLVNDSLSSLVTLAHARAGARPHPSTQTPARRSPLLWLTAKRVGGGRRAAELLAEPAPLVGAVRQRHRVAGPHRPRRAGRRRRRRRRVERRRGGPRRVLRRRRRRARKGGGGAAGVGAAAGCGGARCGQPPAAGCGGAACGAGDAPLPGLKVRSVAGGGCRAGTAAPGLKSHRRRRRRRGAPPPAAPWRRRAAAAPARARAAPRPTGSTAAAPTPAALRPAAA